MAHTKDYILNECKKAMANPSTFYQQPFVNYRGRTTDTGELYNEVVAEYVYKHFDDLKNGIKTISRKSYKTGSHDGVIKSDHEDSKREEEHIAVAIFNQGKKERFDHIGNMVDYQTPLKSNSKDKEVGKIDLLAYDGEKLYILELKKPKSRETMLRCVLEGYTYLNLVDTKKLSDNFTGFENTPVVACPFVFWGGCQNHEMNEDRPWLKKVMNLLNSKPFYIKEENGKYFVTDKGKPSMTKDLNKILDRAIMKKETADNPDIKAGYRIDGRNTPYENYIENDCWKKFVDDMDKHYHTAFEMYGKGSGNELDERKGDKYTYPPKMASFGSSSRMIFNLLKDKEKEGFRFEKKLHTTVGGTANLDGYMMTDDKCIFVEAKCREPYTAKDSGVDWKYKALYKYISGSEKTKLSCTINNPDDEGKDKTKMDVAFKSGQTEIEHFDIKQMICHLLGVATAYLKGTIGKEKTEIGNRRIEFIYLLFNPLAITDNEEIHSIYNATCDECNAIDFKALFEVIIEFLTTSDSMKHKKWRNKDNISQMVNGFEFELTDQNSCKAFIK